MEAGWLLLLLVVVISVFTFVLLRGISTMRVCPPTSLEFTVSDFVQFISHHVKGLLAARRPFKLKGLLGKDSGHYKVWASRCTG